jgi:hypothetical protein
MVPEASLPAVLESFGLATSVAVARQAAAPLDEPEEVQLPEEVMQLPASVEAQHAPEDMAIDPAVMEIDPAADEVMNRGHNPWSQQEAWTWAASPTASPPFSPTFHRAGWTGIARECSTHGGATRAQRCRGCVTQRRHRGEGRHCPRHAAQTPPTLTHISETNSNW